MDMKHYPSFNLTATIEYFDKKVIEDFLGLDYEDSFVDVKSYKNV